jgi:20S proteasome alpha/beta subunit
MTIAAGFVTEDGVVLCTDSQYSGGIKRNGKKIFPMQLNGSAVAFALAGNEAFAKRAIEECFACLDMRENSDRQHSIGGIKDVLEAALKDFHERFVFTRPSEERETVRFSLLVAVASLKEKPVVFCSHETVLIPIDGHECLGAGYFVGHHIIEIGYRSKMSLDDAVALAIHVVTMAKEYVDGVGGPTQILWIKDGIVSPFHPLNAAVYTEPLILNHERESAELLFHAANPRLSDEEFQGYAGRFAATVGLIRKHWRQSFENQDLLQMLMRSGERKKESE